MTLLKRYKMFIWSTVVVVAAIASAYWAYTANHDGITRNRKTTLELRDTVRAIEEGRRSSAGTTCAFGNGIARAGKSALTGQLTGGTVSPKQERALEMLGYPPLAVRNRIARRAARVYTSIIVDAVRAQLEKNGVPARLVIHLGKADGTMDCDLLSELAGIRRTDK